MKTLYESLRDKLRPLLSQRDVYFLRAYLKAIEKVLCRISLDAVFSQSLPVQNIKCMLYLARKLLGGICVSLVTQTLFSKHRKQFQATCYPTKIICIWSTNLFLTHKLHLIWPRWSNRIPV